MPKSLRVELIRDRAEEYIPEGWCCWDCYGDNDIRCSFFQLRKITRNRAKLVDGWPSGNTKLEYCSYLKKYLSIQDNIKDCGIKSDESRCEIRGD